MIITKEFKLLSDICRALNTEWIICDFTNIFAIDSTMNSNFRYCDTNPLGEYNLTNYRFLVKDLSLVEKEMKATKDEVKLNLCNGELLSISCNSEVAFNITGDGRPHDIIRANISSIIAHEPVVYKCLEDDEDFKEVSSLKSKEGMKFYRVDNFVMSIFYGLLKINKGDTVTIGIYEVDDMSFLSMFIINKKKFNIVNHIKYMYTMV